MNAFKLALAQLEYGKRKCDWTLAAGLSQALIVAGFSWAESWQLRGRVVSDELLIGTAMETLLPRKPMCECYARRNT